MAVTPEERVKPGRPEGRRRLVAALVVLGGLCVLLALPLGYLNREVFSSSGFADNSVRSLESPAVRTQLSQDVTQVLVAQDPSLVSVEPVLRGLTETLITSPPVEAIVRLAAGQTHAALFSSSQQSVVVDLANLGVAVIGFIDRQNPQAANRLQQPRSLALKLANRTLTLDLIKLANTVRLLAFLLPLLALTLFAAALATTRNRRRTALAIGVTLTTVGLAALAAYLAGRGVLILLTGASDRDVVAGIFDAFFARFPIWAFVLALAGAVIVGAAVSITSDTEKSRVPHQIIWERITSRPRGTGEALVRALVLLGVSAFAFLNPNGFLKFLVMLLAAWLAYYAVMILLGLLVVSRTGDQPLEPGIGRRFLKLSAASICALVLVTGVLAVVVDQRSVSTGTVPSTGCNGMKTLCGKAFDDVVFPSSHNSMSAAQSGFLNANQGLSIVNQLDSGVRGLLVDVYEGQRNDQGIVRTNLSKKAVDSVSAQIGSEGLAAVQRLAGSVAFGPVSGKKQLFLCHIVCELGATDAVSEFRQIADWMDHNPKEVLVMMVEDAASAAVVKQALSDGGLAGFANDYQPAATSTFPTLQQMIDSNKRLWVMAEQNGDATGWYHRGFKVTQETPYKFTSPPELQTAASCRPNRGGTRPPLFLVNSWVESYPPNPEKAGIVNRRSSLLERARRCEKQRGLTANLLAVDFADRGDVVGAARVLNRR